MRRKWLAVCSLMLFFVCTLQGYAQKKDDPPMLKVAGALAADIRIVQCDNPGSPPLIVERDPVELEKGVRYRLVITKPGYTTYKQVFIANWSGVREKGVKLERLIGPMENQVWVADLEDNVKMEFVPIPAGEFMMGSEEGENDERPVHKVVFKKPFWMAKTEVTMQQYEQFKEVKYTPEPNEIPMPKGADYPVCGVSWKDAQAFCEWLTTKERRRGRLPEGYEYTLPTEAEWEYACRAGTTEDFAGNVDQMAWYNHNSGEKTNPVAKKKPNAWGLYDMHGNVYEWCDDIWYNSYLNAPEDGSQRGDASNEYWVDPSLWGKESGVIYRLYNDDYHVVRGGCWTYSAQDCRSSNRYYHKTNFKLNYLGFRPVLLWNPPRVDVKVTKRVEGKSLLSTEE